MTDAREIIARAIEPFVHHADDVTSVVANTLTTAGYRILGPDEVDALREDTQVAINSMTGECEASHRIALNHMERALRALGRKA